MCKTKNLITFFLALVVFCLATTALATDTPSGEEILEKVDAIRAPGTSFIFNLRITHGNDPAVAVSEFLVRVKDSQKSLVLYTSPPASRGRVLLMVQDNMWIYLPGAGNPIRISPQQQIMGGVSNADVARVVFSLDYRVETVEEHNEEELELLLTPKSRGAAYGKVLLWVEKRDCKPLKAEFFALSGLLLKTVFYKKYQDILGQERPMALEIHDNIKKSEVIVMQYQDMRLEETPDIYFQKTYMERAGKKQGSVQE